MIHVGPMTRAWAMRGKGTMANLVAKIRTTVMVAMGQHGSTRLKL